MPNELQQRLNNNKGSAMLGATVLMLMMATAAVALVELNSTDSITSVNDMNSVQSLGVGNAGLQWALDRIDRGLDPRTTDKEMANGTFSVYPDTTSGSLTVVSQVGEAIRTQTVGANYAKDCVDLYVGYAQTENNQISNILLEKNCNTNAILSKITITANTSSCALSTNCDGSFVSSTQECETEVEYEDVGNPPRNKVWICHIPPGNPENKQTISVGASAVASHISQHGDYTGPCIVSEEEVCTTTTTGTSDSLTCTVDNNDFDEIVDCAEDTSGLLLTNVNLANTPIFSSGSIPTNASTATTPGEETDVLDSVLDNNSVYALDLTFNDTVPTGAWFTITTEFADGTKLFGVFKIAEQAAAVTEEELNEDDPPAAQQDVAEVEDNDEAKDADNAQADENDTEEDFEVDGGIVTVSAQQQVDLRVIGSAITCGSGGAEINVRTKLGIDNQFSDLWNYNDVDGGETYTITTDTNSSEIVVRANANSADCNHYDISTDSDNTLQAKLLRNGESAPPLEGFGGQQDVTEFLAPYLDETGSVQIENNQVIMLFELGVDMSQNPYSMAADFQDLVILMTITDL